MPYIDAIHKSSVPEETWKGYSSGFVWATILKELKITEGELLALFQVFSLVSRTGSCSFTKTATFEKM